MDIEAIDPDLPRRLTDAEINDILTVVPDLKTASIEVGEYNKRSLLLTLKEQLSEIEVTPKGYVDLKVEIFRRFNESLIKPGIVVGLTAAEALGGPITQMALNSFHKSGSSKNVSYGIGRVEELINASQNIKNPSCSIFFKNQNLIFDDVIKKVRPELTEIYFSRVVRGIPDAESVSDIEQPWWYQPYRALIRNDFDNISTTVLIINLDTDIMYSYKITMEDLAKKLEEDGSVIAVYSPLNIGVIHIYPIDSVVRDLVPVTGLLEETNISMTYLWHAFIPSLDKMRIKGVEGILKIYPVDAPVLQIVKDQVKLTQRPNTFLLYINHVRTKITGITVSKLMDLCKLVGIIIVKAKPNYIKVNDNWIVNEEAEYIVVEAEGDPMEMMGEAIKKDKQDEKKYEEERKNRGEKILRRPPTDIYRASRLVYADTDGSVFKSEKSTLRTLLGHSQIDNTRTYSNNVHEINEVLGIEAARSFLIKDFTDMISSEGQYLNPRHTVLLIDYMVSTGLVSGITFSGLKRQKTDALHKASYERAMDIFKEAGGFGEKTEIVGTSSSIYVGKQAQIGQGYSRKFIDVKAFEKLENEMAKESNFELEVGEFKEAIDLMDILDTQDESEQILINQLETEMFGGSEGSSETRIEDQMFAGVLDSLNDLEIGSLGPVSDNEKAPPPVAISKELDEVINNLQVPPMCSPNVKPSLDLSCMEDTGLEMPTEILEELENLVISEAPSVPSVPSVLPVPTILPRLSPAKSPAKSPFKKTPVKKKQAITFNVEDFL